MGWTLVSEFRKGEKHLSQNLTGVEWLLIRSYAFSASTCLTRSRLARTGRRSKLPAHTALLRWSMHTLCTIPKVRQSLSWFCGSGLSVRLTWNQALLARCLILCRFIFFMFSFQNDKKYSKNLQKSLKIYEKSGIIKKLWFSETSNSFTACEDFSSFF